MSKISPKNNDTGADAKFCETALDEEEEEVSGSGSDGAILDSSGDIKRSSVIATPSAVKVKRAKKPGQNTSGHGVLLNDSAIDNQGT